MTYQATIQFNQHSIRIFQADVGGFRTCNHFSQFLILQLDAPGPESAHQTVKTQWKKIRQQLPQVSSPRLLRVSEIPVCCPRCGATELSFCQH